VTLAFHPWRMGFGMGYWKRGTRWGFAAEGGSASVGVMGRCRVPMTPRWSRTAVWTVSVSPIWREMRPRSHIDDQCMTLGKVVGVE